MQQSLLIQQDVILDLGLASTIINVNRLQTFIWKDSRTSNMNSGIKRVKLHILNLKLYILYDKSQIKQYPICTISSESLKLHHTQGLTEHCICRLFAPREMQKPLEDFGQRTDMAQSMCPEASLYPGVCWGYSWFAPALKWFPGSFIFNPPGRRSGLLPPSAVLECWSCSK